MPTLREKVRGMFLGIGIGDALGMPVETWSKDRIKETYPEGVREYKTPSGHRWFNGELAGSTTDDCALTIATAKGLMEEGNFDLKHQATQMVVAMKEAMKKGNPGGSGVPGWGYTTVRAVRNLANNVPWYESGKTADPDLGHGNGVVMRQAPIAAAWAFGKRSLNGLNFEKLIAFSAMTHYTKQSAIATVVHNSTLVQCLIADPAEFNCDNVVRIRTAFKNFFTKKTDHLVATKIDMWEQLDKVRTSKGWDADKIIAECGGGSCNIGHSLPFCYAFWINNHDNIQLLYDVVEAGGDTDTNASIVGGMLGALHGTSIFPEHLVNGLIEKDKILNVAEEFCDKFGIDTV